MAVTRMPTTADKKLLAGHKLSEKRKKIVAHAEVII
jgi:hypothetical protein